MRRPILAICVAALTAVLASCGGTAGSSTTTETAATAGTGTTLGASEPQDTRQTIGGENPGDPLALKFGDTAELGDLLVTVRTPIDDTANLDETVRSILLEPGEKAIYCMVTIVNNGREPFSYNTLAFTMYDSEGLTYDSLLPVSTKPDLGSGDLPPGRTVKGTISYAMPGNATPAYVDFNRNLFETVEASWGN